jgi:cyclopropane-fatty-acyl-phospholipid synthase
MTGNAGHTMGEVIFGGSPEAIRYHYDVGNEFYRLWLDKTVTYSAAKWISEDDTLDAAQIAKLDYHLDNVALQPGGNLLDIGCGWGSLLSRARQRATFSNLVGLTLSEEQARHIEAFGFENMRVCRESWIEHQPQGKYDGIVSIGAFEHFAHPQQGTQERLDVYRRFFECCRDWLAPGGALSLQTIVYADMDSSTANKFIANEIFPDAELPRPQELFIASDRLFEIVSYRNDRLDYARTCEVWLANLRRSRGTAVVLVGEDTVQRYERYLMLSAIGFRLGRIGLVRLRLVPYRSKTRGNEQ